MKFKLGSIFVKEKCKPKIVKYQEGKKRPAWIKIGGLPKDAWYVNVVVLDKTKKTYSYKCWNKQIDVFVPMDINFEDIKSYYNEISKVYDNLIKNLPKNIEAGKLMLKFLKKYKKNKEVEILDLGAGTGIITELFSKEGYKNITLIDISKGMLNKAKKRETLKRCKFVRQDLKKLKLNKKYDVIMSFFSLGLETYFTEKETINLIKKIKKHLKKKGLFILMGFYYIPKENPYFKTLKKGKMITDKKKGYYFEYYIGERK